MELRAFFSLCIFLILVTFINSASVETNDACAYGCSSATRNKEPPMSRMNFDPADLQLEEWAAEHSIDSAGFVKDDFGRAIPSLTASLAVGDRGPALMQDVFMLENQAQFNRERIPERTVHAKGHGAFGYFRVTHDISTLTKADFLNGIGKTTPVFIRFSTVAGESGSADLIRDAIGVGIKFFTIDGIFDVLGCGAIPIFPIRDPMVFKDLNKSRKRNPETHLPDPNMLWDFISLRPETVLHTVYLFSDFPANSRVTSMFAVNAFKFVNADNTPVFVRFHFISQQPFTWFNNTEIDLVSGMDPDYKTRDLYDAIANKNFPRWDFFIQVMTAEQALKYPGNPFDTTILWRPEKFPLIPVGELTLDRNPTDYFNDVEQSGFCVSRLVPGIESPPNKMFTARTFIYADAQRYRLGTNNGRLDINKPQFPVNNYFRDGFARDNPNGMGGPNYFPNSFHGPSVNDSAMETLFNVKGYVNRHDNVEMLLDNFRLSRLYLYKDLTANQRKRVVENIGQSLSQATPEIRNRALTNLFDRIAPEFGEEVEAQVEIALAARKKKEMAIM